MLKATLFAAPLLAGAIVAATPARGQPPQPLPTAGAMSRGYGDRAPAGFATADFGQRDASGNLVIVNGGRDPLPGGSTFPGWSMPGQTAVAIGNQIAVDVSGSWNTIIIDAVQTNTGDITARTGVSASPGDRN